MIDIADAFSTRCIRAVVRAAVNDVLSMVAVLTGALILM